MKHVERVRDRILRGQSAELQRVRIFLSQTDGNQEAVDALRDKSGEMILARVTELIMQELGHATEASVEVAHSRVRRAVAKVR